MIEERYTPEQLEQMHQQLWHCVLQFANLSATQERHRIARDLHDSLGHALTALNFQLQTAIKLCKPDPTQAEEFLTEAHRLVGIATQEVRQSVRSLRSEDSEARSLEPLIDSLVHDFRQTTGVTPSVTLDLTVELPAHLVTPLYRIIQESLNNIRKYAQATEVEIRMTMTTTMINLMVRDNGRGFEMSNVAGGYGLRGMQERVAVFQGTFSVESRLGTGCCITTEIPVQLPAIAPLKKVNPSIEIGDWQPLNLDEWHWMETVEETSSWNPPDTLELSLESMNWLLKR